VPLLYANERVLRDIGLSRADIVDSLSGPLCADPSQLLIARINTRRESYRLPNGGQPVLRAPAQRCGAGKERSLVA
jgi:hypothetical protein